jgi:S1-C subfamily serine protease
MFALLANGIVDLLASLQGKIDIFETHRQIQIVEIKNIIKDIIEITIKNDEKQIEMITDISKLTKYIAEMSIENDKKQLELIKDLMKNVEILKEKQILTERELKVSKSLKSENVKRFKKANLLIYNTTVGTSGSGTHIKIKNENYILTASHLIDEPDDFIYGILDNGDWQSMKLIKINRKKDLALFKIYNLEHYSYLEISDEIPEQGDKITVIGNPAGLIDVITDGIIAKIEKEGYLFTNQIFFGSSGGAILYKDKIIGVVTQFRTLFQIPVFVNYGFGCKLEMINEFLEDLK